MCLPCCLVVPELVGDVAVVVASRVSRSLSQKGVVRKKQLARAEGENGETRVD